MTDDEQLVADLRSGAAGPLEYLAAAERIEEMAEDIENLESWFAGARVEGLESVLALMDEHGWDLVSRGTIARKVAYYRSLV